MRRGAAFGSGAGPVRRDALGLGLEEEQLARVQLREGHGGGARAAHVRQLVGLPQQPARLREGAEEEEEEVAVVEEVARVVVAMELVAI